MPQAGNRMSYHTFRFSKHTICRIAWRVIAKFPEWGYYDGPNKAQHLCESERRRSYAKQTRHKLIDYVCWYEFGDSDPMNPNIEQLYTASWKKAGSGMYGHNVGASYQDRKMSLYKDIWSDRPDFVMNRPLGWFELPFSVHSWVRPFVYDITQIQRTWRCSIESFQTCKA
jgi:hypothetical protein